MKGIPITIQMERRTGQDFGFTLRHMVVNPVYPTRISEVNHNRETFYVHEIARNSAAHFAGLMPGDRVLKINNLPACNATFAVIQEEIHNCTNLTLEVAPQFSDPLQMRYIHLASKNKLIKL